MGGVLSAFLAAAAGAGDVSDESRQADAAALAADARRILTGALGNLSWLLTASDLFPLDAIAELHSAPQAALSRMSSAVAALRQLAQARKIDIGGK